MKDSDAQIISKDMVETHLRSVPLFSACSADVIKNLAQGAVFQSHKKGKVLFIHEEQASRYYLICSGWVKIFRETLDGTQAVIDILSARHLVGDRAVLLDDKYPYSVEVVENADVISLPSHELKTELERNPQLAQAMMKLMAQEHKQQVSEIEHLSIQNAPQRIGCFLLRLTTQGQKGRVKIHLPYDKTLIASRLGMQPETFSRALKKLKKETGIEVKGATVLIEDLQRLSDFSCAMCSSNYPCKDLTKKCSGACQ